MQAYDVVVVGGSSAGVGAALAAGRAGATVALVEDSPALGGMLANGVSNIDTFSYESLSGIFEEFRVAVLDHYRPVLATDPIFSARPQVSRHLDGRSRQSNEAARGGRWEPHVADAIFRRMVAAVPTIDLYDRRAVTGVLTQGSRVTGVVTERTADAFAYSLPAGDEQVFRGGVVVDATHEADVAALAGVPYRVGREARSPLEPHAGEITFFNQTSEFVSGTGRQDRAIVSYGIRLVVQSFPRSAGRDHLIAEPPGYDPAKYEHAHFGGAERLNPTMPGGKAEINANPFGNELQEANWAWPEADRAERAEIYAVYRNHALGFLYHLQTARGATHIGLAIDEFADNGNVPYRLFVREARRICGRETMTEADINPFVRSGGWTSAPRPDSIAIGHYPIDSKPVRAKADLSTADKGPGDFFLRNVSFPFQVPYGAIIPRDVDGLLVPAALSATHVAFSAVRMDPTWTVLGQAAGVAAALSAQDGVPPGRLAVERLQSRLLDERVKLAFYWDLPADHRAWRAVQELTVRGVLAGYPDRRFRPDQAVTRAEVAAVLYRALAMWPSVSDAHFTDLPHHHWAFRYLETFFDGQLLGPFGVRPLWPNAGPYDAATHAGFNNRRHDEFGAIEPERPVTAGEAAAILRSVAARAGRPSSWRPALAEAESDRAVPRGDFAVAVAELVR